MLFRAGSQELALFAKGSPFGRAGAKRLRGHHGFGLSHKKEYSTMQIFNTLTRQKEEFVPQVPGE